MTGIDFHKAPFPYFGGKRDAAPAIWAALGDVEHYTEAFCGSLATLLLRPHEANRTYHSETVNDADGLLVNFWRSVQLHHDATAEAASWPVSEADLHARHLWLVRWRENHELEHLMGDPSWCDPQAAGFWCFGQSSWIGSGWCSGTGPWTADADGRLYKQGKAPRAGGVDRKRPHLANDGRGCNRPQLREPGVARKRPHLANAGQGCNRPQLREEGVGECPEWHPMTMPELRNWFGWLSARLRHVRILNGDWARACTNGALKTLNVRNGKGHAGVFLDPPYGDAAGRTVGLYSNDSGTVAADVLAWCQANGADPRLRIVLAGYAGEGHEALEAAGWTAVEWYAKGFLRGGMGNTSKGDAKGQQQRERLWLSPHCLRGPATPPRRCVVARPTVPTVTSSLAAGYQAPGRR